ncbi:MAG: phosphatase PAP2 family protein [Deltaproteobacteria bacterium]|nr:phosphatase PAP2 family protein [Deltaproteobacteria bacterium]
MLKHLLRSIALALLLLFGLSGPAAAGEHRGFEGPQQTFGPSFQPSFPVNPSPSRIRPDLQGLTRWVRYWNQVAIDTSGIDHTPVAPGETRVFGEQFGPCRASRAMAIVHIAMFDALNAINGGYRGYTNIPRTPAGASAQAAIALAAHDTLTALFPSQTPRLDGLLAGELAQVQEGSAKINGIRTGQVAAAAILALRQNDGSSKADPVFGVDYFPKEDPGYWRQDPISLSTLALGAYWGEVKPFVMNSGSQFRLAKPPELTSDAYTKAFNEVKDIGGDGITTPTSRSADQTFIGIFWAYDGTPSLCAPPRLYNQVTAQIAEQKGTKGMELARLFALVNVAMADAAIASWDSKYYWDFWRPVTGIRESDPGTGPTGKGDGNPATVGDPTFTPQGSPASNLNGPNFTPPFPSYPSGHACFGGVIFQTLRHFYGTDQIAFTFVSDEFNGVTKDNQGNVRPYMPRSYDSLSQAEDENGQSRIYLGIHWRFDKNKGIAQGRRLGDYVWPRIFQPQRRGSVSSEQ